MTNEETTGTTEQYSFGDLLAFRKDIYRTMQLYNLTSRTVDISLVEAYEEVCLQIFLYGADFACFIHEQGGDIGADDLDLMRQGLDFIQDQMPSDELSFVAGHYEDALSIYHCGFLFMRSTYKEKQSGEKPSAEMEEAINAFRKIEEARENYLAKEEKIFRNMIRIFIKDEKTQEFLDNHLEESYLLIRKGKAWWKSGVHKEVSDPISQDEEMRNEYFRLVLMNGMMQHNAIIDTDKEVGFLLFKLGAIIVYYEENQEQ